MRARRLLGDALRIAAFELVRHVRSRRFLLATFGLPLFVALLVAASLWASSLGAEPDAPWGVVGAPALAAQTGGRALSPDEARRAFAAGEIAGFVTLEADGRATLWAPARSGPPSELGRALRERARSAVLAEAPPERRETLADPLELRHAALSAPEAPARGAADLLAALGLALGLPLVFVVTVLFSTSLLVTAVAEERAGRLLELLASSSSPAGLIAGKVIGLGGVGLLQTSVWLGAGALALLALAGDGARDALTSLAAPWVLLALAYFALGYLLFAAVMVAVGVWMGQPREAQQVAGIASLFLTLPFALMGLLLLRPSSPAARVLSLLPPTAPAAMPMRLALRAAAPAEVAIGLLGLAATVGLAFWLTGAIFSRAVLGRRGSGWRLLRRSAAPQPSSGEAGSRGSTSVTPPAGPTSRPLAPPRGASGAAGDRVPAARARNLGLVAVHEAWTHLRRRSFLLTTFGLPVLGLLVTGVVAVAGAGTARRAASELGEVFELDALQRQSEAPRLAVQGPPELLVAAGLLGEDRDPRTAEGAGNGPFLVVESEAEGRALVRSGQVDRFFVLPRDYPTSRVVIEWRPNLAPPERAPVLEARLRRALWPEASEEQRRSLARPAQRIEREILEPPPAPPGSRAAEAPTASLDLERDPLPALVVLGVGALLYTAIFAASSFLLQSVTTEKENRVIELLLTSVPAIELLGGKILGLGLLGLLQLLVWSGSAVMLSQGGLLAAGALAALQVGPRLLLVGLLYFLLGYAFYAALMGAVGALVPSFQESGPLTFVVLFPAWTPFFFLEAILRAPDGALARVLSLAPPTAPLVMMLRVAVGAVAWWELLVGIIAMIAGTVAVVWAAATVFNAGNLLSSATRLSRRLLRRRRPEAEHIT